jgi:hypothetical protein
LKRSRRENMTTKAKTKTKKKITRVEDRLQPPKVAGVEKVRRPVVLPAIPKGRGIERVPAWVKKQRQSQVVPTRPTVIVPAPRPLLYWAYGSNLNVRQMKVRCPKAEKVGPFPLTDGRLIFRGVADVVGDVGETVPGGLWWITRDCERALDRYEGYFGKGYGNMYDKRYITLSVKGEVVDCLFYKMNSRGVYPPSQAYLDSIREGYADFGLDEEKLAEAVEYSYSRKRKTADVRERYRRKGRPSLAKAFRPGEWQEDEVETKIETWGDEDWDNPDWDPKEEKSCA